MLHDASEYRRLAKIAYRIVKVSFYHNENQVFPEMLASHREHLIERRLKVALWIRLRTPYNMGMVRVVVMAQVSSLVLLLGGAGLQFQ
jgi:hypothetical protein